MFGPYNLGISLLFFFLLENFHFNPYKIVNMISLLFNNLVVIILAYIVKFDSHVTLYYNKQSIYVDIINCMPNLTMDPKKQWEKVIGCGVDEKLFHISDVYNIPHNSGIHEIPLGVEPRMLWRLSQTWILIEKIKNWYMFLR